MGAQANEVLESLVAPAVPGDKSFKEVKSLLKYHYSPKSSVIVETCRFNRRVQDQQESLKDSDYAQLLQGALRDRLVKCVMPEGSQRALFAVEGLTF